MLLSAVVGASLLSTAALAPASAETISSALSRAYGGNPDLNQQRASARAVDENLPRAIAGYRPTINATASVGRQVTETQLQYSNNQRSVATNPRSVGLTATETLFNGNRTGNGVKQAESQVFAAREQLRTSEQNILNSGAQAYMNVLRDTAILDLRRNNVQVLQQQLKQTQDRFQVGEVTRTDVAQSQAALAQGQSDAFTAASNLQTSVANFRQIIGVEPKNLAPARPIDNLLPRTIDQATSIAQTQHPSIQTALHNVDVQELAVKIAEGQLYPTVTLNGSVTRGNDLQNVAEARTLTGSIIGQLSVPIYEGGAIYAAVRQAKEQLGQVRLQADLSRDQVRAAVVSSWGVYQNSKAVIEAANAQVRAAEVALNGVREEANVGQRTTLDVLNAQQTLLNARVALVSAQRDRVVGSYAVLAAVGGLSAGRLGLNVVQYDPTIHFDQVKDKWIGLRTPDGR